MWTNKIIEVCEKKGNTGRKVISWIVVVGKVLEYNEWAVLKNQCYPYSDI